MNAYFCVFGCPFCRYPTKNIRWREVSKLMNGRNEYQCYNTWYQRLHNKVAVNGRWSLANDLELLEHIQSLKLDTEAEIPWHDLPFQQTAVVLKRRFKLACRSASSETEDAAAPLHERLLDCIENLRSQINFKQAEAASKVSAALTDKHLFVCCFVPFRLL